MKSYLIMTLVLGFVGYGLCQNINQINSPNNIAETGKNVTNVDRYNNLTTNNSAVKVIFKDFLTGKEMLIVLSNYDLFDFIAYEKGYANIKGEFINSDLVKHFKIAYVSLMTDNNNKPIVININEFDFYRKKRIKYDYLVSQVLSISDFNMITEKEYIDKYFEFDEYGAVSLKQEYRNKYNDDAAFKSLLIDLGYDVRCHDCNPTDWIITTVPVR